VERRWDESWFSFVERLRLGWNQCGVVAHAAGGKSFFLSVGTPAIISLGLQGSTDLDISVHDGFLDKSWRGNVLSTIRKKKSQVKTPRKE